MTPDLSTLLARLTAMRRRERALLAGRAALLSLAALLLTWGLAMALAARGVGRDPARLGLGAGLGALALVGLALGLRAWWRAGDERRQALRVEAALPALRGRLTTALERREGPRPGESVGILTLMVRRAEAALVGFDPRRLLPLSTLRRPALATAALALAWGVYGLLAPVGPVEALRWLGGAPRAVASPAERREAAPEDALIGDIVLRYEYPAYTGLPPAVVENSNGAAHGPPGTRVTVQARTAEPFDDAALHAYDLPPELAELEGGRQVTGGFVIGGEGAWRLLFKRGGVEARSADHAIEPEPDSAPVVEVIAESDRMEVTVDQVIPLRWRARDDFGVVKVELAISGREAVTLREPLDAPSSLDDDLNRSPAQLGLRPGDEVTLRVVAMDNDEVGGSKAGESRPIRVVVMGPKAVALRFLRLRRELRDALTDVLAGFALDPDPLPPARGELAAWAARAATRFEPVEALVDAHWDGFDERSLEGRMIEELRRQANAMLRFVEAVAQPGAVEPLQAADAETLAALRGELVTTIEADILVLDRMVRYQAVGELQGFTERLRGEGRGLEAGAEADAPPGALLTRLDRVDELTAQLARAVNTYDQGRLAQLVTGWTDDISRASAASREAFGRGDDEAGRRLALATSRSIERMAASLEAMREEMEAATEEEQQAIKEFIEELERIEAEERALLERTVEARGADDGGVAEVWARAEELARAMSSLGQSLSGRVEAEAAQRLPREATDAARLARQTQRLERAVQARDLSTSLEEAAFVLFSARQVEDVLRYAASRPRSNPPDNAAHLRDLNAIARDAMALERLLSQIDDSVNRPSPGLARVAPELTADQRGLHDDLQATLPMARQLAGQLPMGAPGLVEGLEGADREMARAVAALERSRGVEAAGAEEAAADRVRQALEALARAAAAMAEMQEGMGGGEGPPGAGGGGRDDDPSRQISDERIELPDPEAFQTDEAYREALLRGMRDEVPPEYEALKRRYYEELVRQ